MSGKTTPQRVGPDTPTLGIWPASVARRIACCTHCQTGTRDTSIDLHCPGVPRGPDRQVGKVEGEEVFTGTRVGIICGSAGTLT